MGQRRYRSLGGALLVNALLVLLGLGCVDAAGGGSTGGTVLYAYDSTTSQVLEWDANSFFASDSPTVLKSLASNAFNNHIQTLAWGGLCLDATGNRLYLVNETTGDVVRVNNVRNATGTLPTTGSDAPVSFTLGASSSERLSGGKFGQAAVDLGTGTLYVCERNDSETRIWVVANAGSQAADSTVAASNTVKVTGDKACTGVAAGLSGQLYGYFESGNDIGPDKLSGPRLRKGGTSGFSSDASVLVGASTLLGKYGSLALDTGNNLLFVARHDSDAGSSANPVLAFSVGKFNGGGFNQGADFTLGTFSAQQDLRVLAHPGNKEWLAALSSNSETASGKIHIWKLPRDVTGVPKVKTFSNSTFKGIAFDGNN